MKKYLNNLPVQNAPIKEKIAIAFQNFMGGAKMYFSDGYEITTQAGFKNAVLKDIKITEKQIDKIISDYNKKYVTPDNYRNLKMQLREYQQKEFIEDNKKTYKKLHPVEYILTKLCKRQ